MFIDELDRRILDALKKNARMSYRRMALIMSVTTPTVISRVRKLEDAGIIEGYSIKVRGEPFEGELFIISGRKGRSLKEGMAQIEGVKNVMSTSNGSLLILCEPGASSDVMRACKGSKAKVVRHEITSRVTHRGVKALCAYCRSPMNDALVAALGGRRYYVCCPICARELRDRYEKLEAQARRKR